MYLFPILEIVSHSSPVFTINFWLNLVNFDNKIKACNFPEAANCDGSSVSGSEGGDAGVVSVGDKDK